jgi:hypothetical protein
MAALNMIALVKSKIAVFLALVMGALPSNFGFGLRTG